MQILCSPCKEHYAMRDEDIERTLARARSHEDLAYAYARRAREHASNVENEVRDVRRQVASALKARGRWRSVAIAMVEAHTPVGKDKCRCGTRWPCLTLSIMQDRDPSARREAERAADSRALSEAKMRELLEDVFIDTDEGWDERRYRA